MKIQAVIFDLDGTLIDSIPDIAGAANNMLAERNYPIHDVSSFIQWVGNGAQKLIERTLPGNFDENEVIKCLDEYLEIYRNSCTIKTKPYKGIDDILNFLTEQKLPIAILTNKPHDITLKVVDFYFSGWKFDIILGQRKGFPKKPDPAVALEIAAELKILPGEVLFVGDSDTDITTALSAGMISSGVTWGYKKLASLQEAGCEYIFNDPKEIIRFIRERNSEK